MFSFTDKREERTAGQGGNALGHSAASLSGGSEYWPLNEKSQQKRCHVALYLVRRTEVKAIHCVRQQAG